MYIDLTATDHYSALGMNAMWMQPFSALPVAVDAHVDKTFVRYLLGGLLEPIDINDRLNA